MSYFEKTFKKKISPDADVLSEVKKFAKTDKKLRKLKMIENIDSYYNGTYAMFDIMVMIEDEAKLIKLMHKAGYR